MTDPITDMLNRIRNAQAVFHQTVVIPFSNLKYEIAKILEKERFVEKVEKKGKKSNKVIEITLKYQKEETSAEGQSGKMRPAISGSKRISRPGQRIYTRSKEIRLVREGYGIAIISTPEGLITAREAKKRKLGGEILCEIW